MDTTRRDFLTVAVTTVGATATPTFAHAEEHSHQDLPSDLALRVKSLESLLVEKGLVDRAAIDAMVDVYENKVGPRNGARVVARAWIDSAFKQRLLTNGTAAIAELGYSGEQGQDITVVENTPKVHNLIVCTLCSCYPWPVLGLPPVWYKSAPYRSRAVIDPRGVLREFGSEVAEEVEVRVWDGRVYALNRAMRAWRKWNLDADRHALEVMPPSEYLRMSYYERWLTRLE